MNQLYGYPSSPTVKVSRMGALAAEDTTAAQASIMSFINGDYADQLNAIHDDITAQYAQTDAMQASVQALPDGPNKTAAFKLQQAAVAAVTQQVVQYRQARDQYNDIAGQIATYTMGAYKPALLSDMGQLETVMTVAVIVAVAYAISQLANVIGAIRGQSNASKGYLDQAAGLVQQAGGAIKETGGAILNAGTAIPKIGLTLVGVAAAGLGLWFLFKLVQSRKSSAPASSVSVSVSPGAMTTSPAGV